MTHLVFVNDDICHISELLEVLPELGLRGVLLQAADEHAALLLGLAGGAHVAQRPVLSPFHVFIQTRFYFRLGFFILKKKTFK